MTTFFILDTPIALFSLSYAEEPVWVFRVAATAADFPSGKAEPTRLGSNPIRRRQRRMRGNLPGPEGLARRGASAALHGLPVVPPRAAPRALHPLPLLANAAHAEYSDRLLGDTAWLWTGRFRSSCGV